MIFVVVAVAILGLAAFAIINGQNVKNSQENSGNTGPSIPVSNKMVVNTTGDQYIGSNDASITIIEFTDFQCPYCSKFHEETFPIIKQNYIDTGKVKYVVKDFPLAAHAYAEQSAIATECANGQGKFWEYVDMLYKNQDYLSKPLLKNYAKSLGLNETTFNQCLDNRETFSEVEKDAIEGTRVGVTGTPYFFINGVAVDGAYPYEVFQSVIEQELSTNKN